MSEKKLEASDSQSPGAIEKALKNKWMAVAGGSIAAILILVTFTSGENKAAKNMEAAKTRERVTNLLPKNVEESNWITQAQTELRIQNQKLDALVQENAELRKELSAERRAAKAEVDRFSGSLKTMEELQKAFKEQEKERERLLAEVEQSAREAVLRVQREAEARENADNNRPRSFDFSAGNNRPQGSNLPPGVVAPPTPRDILDEDGDGDRNSGRNTGRNSSGSQGGRQPPVTINAPTVDHLPPGARSNANRRSPSARAPIVIEGAPMNTSAASGPDGKVAVAEQVQPNQFAGYIPAGSFVEVALLSGAEVGTADFTRANPQPFMMRLDGKAITPGDGRYDLDECFAIGSGFGELSSERVFVKANRLICLDKNKKLVLEEQIDTYMVDSDGTQGLRGKVVRRNGQVIAKSLLAGFAQGIAEVARAAGQANATTLTAPVSSNGLQSTSQNIDEGALARAGFFGGASNAIGQLSDLYIKEAKSIFPVIQVPTGRKGTLVFLKGKPLRWNSYDGLYTVKTTPTTTSE